mmetsp:Transcript_53556/g.148921  ORF Transcript_53556/g.148921 Transcript_53556/m.148921 type:complete len:205 (-) Transcript_53556:1392-2006(-)
MDACNQLLAARACDLHALDASLVENMMFLPGIIPNGLVGHSHYGLAVLGHVEVNALRVGKSLPQLLDVLVHEGGAKALQSVLLHGLQVFRSPMESSCHDGRREDAATEDEHQSAAVVVRFVCSQPFGVAVVVEIPTRQTGGNFHKDSREQRASEITEHVPQGRLDARREGSLLTWDDFSVYPSECRNASTMTREANDDRAPNEV